MCVCVMLMMKKESVGLNPPPGDEIGEEGVKGGRQGVERRRVKGRSVVGCGGALMGEWFVPGSATRRKATHTRGFIAFLCNAAPTA